MVIHTNEEYIDAVRRIRRWLGSKKKFEIDTNIIIILADFKNIKLLEEILECNSYIFTENNKRELEKFERTREFRAGLTRIISWFKREAIRRERYEKRTFEEKIKELKPFAFIMPRKLVADVMIGSRNSYVKQLIKIFEIALKKMRGETEKEREKIYSKYAGIAKELRIKLSKKLEKTFYKLCKEHNVDPECVLKAKLPGKYFDHVEKFKDRILRKIASTMAYAAKYLPSAGEQIEYLIKELDVIGNKTYNEDLRFVASAIENGARGLSRDIDVRSLLVIYGCRKAA